MNLDKYLDITYLRTQARTNDSRPYWFGLGFIQLKLTNQLRIHIWTPAIPRPEREEIHDHRYNFSSQVLAGKLIFELYDVIRTSLYPPDYELFATNCKPGHEGVNPKTMPVKIEPKGTYELSVGSNYWISREQFHTTEATKFAITLVERDVTQKFKDFAFVVKRADKPTSCPFTDQLPEEVCWEYITEALYKI